MSITKLPDGRWKLDIRIGGRNGKRIRKTAVTKSELLAYQNYIVDEIEDKPWLGEAEDNRLLSELCQRWYDLYGQQLQDPGGRLKKLKLICSGLGDPVARKLTVNDFATYRQLRLDGEIEDLQGVKRVIKPKTINIEHSYLAAVFSKLKQLGEWRYPNPLDGFAMFKIPEREMGFLYPEEIPIVLSECANSENKDLLTVTKICLATGCRWSEAEKLTGNQIVGNRITFIKTKGKKNRTVPISEDLAAIIPRKRGRLFSDSRKAFERAIGRTKLQFPDGQMTHILRHTFASHFMSNGGNILVLQKILGHADIKDTMVYAHFAPDHLNDAIKKNPLVGYEKYECF